MLGFVLFWNRVWEDRKRQPLLGRQTLPGRRLSELWEPLGYCLQPCPAGLGEGLPLMPWPLHVALLSQNLRAAGLEGISEMGEGGATIPSTLGKPEAPPCYPLRAKQQEDFCKHVAWGLLSIAVNTGGCLSIPRMQRSGL